MVRFSRPHGLSIKSKPGLFFLASLGFSALTGSSVFAGQIDCEKVRTGTDPIRYTIENTPETEFKQPPPRIGYADVVRNDPEGILVFTSVNSFKLKTVLTKSLLPRLFELVGKGVTTTYTYDTDISKLELKPGASFTLNVVESAIGGFPSTSAHHVYDITEGGHFDVAGCSFPVVTVHHTAHYVRGDTEWDFILDSLVSTDLGFALRSRRQILGGTSKMETGTYVSVTTDLSTTADMTKDP